MADTKITALTALTAADPASDVLPIVDISDTTMAASGTTKKISVNNILGAGGTATLASATITGDLTVDTSTLKVDSANNRVGIGTASPADTLDVNGRITALRYLSSSSNASLPSFAVSAGNGAYNSGTNEIGFSINSTSAMTLNASGLGVGATVYDKITALNTIGLVTATTADFSFRNSVGTVVQRLRYTDSDASLVIGSASAISYAVSLGGNTTTRAVTIDASSNVGIGVTPSAWTAGFKAFQVGVGSALWTNNTVTRTSLTTNFYYNGGDLFIGNGYAHGYWQDGANGHRWFTSSVANASGAGASATMNQAMTLDTSGNLLIGKTVSLFSTVGVEASQAGFLSLTNSASTNAATNLSVYSTGAAAFRFYVGLAGTVFATNTTISAISDARLKENVQDLDVGLDAILALKPRKFDWKAGKGKDIKGDRGFIAQEFETVFPNLIDEWKDEAPEGEAPYKSVRQDLIPVLVKAIQELTARVQTLETR